MKKLFIGFMVFVFLGLCGCWDEDTERVEETQEPTKVEANAEEQKEVIQEIEPSVSKEYLQSQLDDITIYNASKDENDIVIDIEFADNFTANMVIASNQFNTEEVLEVLSTNNLIEADDSILIRMYGISADKYGNKNNRTMMMCAVYQGSEVNKINFDNVYNIFRVAQNVGMLPNIREGITEKDYMYLK